MVIYNSNTKAAYKLPNAPLTFDLKYPYGHWGLVELVTSTIVGLVIIDNI